MKGYTHALIGLAAASSLPITNNITGAEKLLPYAFAFAGSLICDIDTGKSTISNTFSPIKLKYIKTFVNFTFALLGIIGAMLLKDSEYIYLFISLIILGGLNLNNISSKVFNIMKKVTIILISSALIITGFLYQNTPLVLLGLYLISLLLSKHRGYSHSFMAVILAFITLRYTFDFYNVSDYSLIFCIGMLSHILGDMCTQKGVTLLFPLKKKYSFPLTFKTGSIIESVFCIVSVSIIIKSTFFS
ncbi:metal-dependent hydrolase [Herbivorax sp. ANBcel31]|uniref:metal-dependent hydrolase n=1 Tax=Herbivorax sp. ANBcel31 TaxID=3069754 RepID=UPI003594854B